MSLLLYTKCKIINVISSNELIDLYIRILYTLLKTIGFIYFSRTITGCVTLHRLNDLEKNEYFEVINTYPRKIEQLLQF